MLEPLFFSSFLKNSLFWRILNIEVDDSYYEPPVYPSLNLSNNGVSCFVYTPSILFYLFIFYFWLCQVLVAAPGNFCCRVRALRSGAWVSL